MDSERFFYSTDGANVHGPVTRDALRLLIQNGVVDSTSHLCREGENEWYPLNPDDFQPGATARLPAYEPPPYVPTTESLERMKGPPEPWEAHSSAPAILNAICWVALFGGTIALLVITISVHSWPPDSLAAFYGSIFGGFFACLLLIGVPAYLISVPFTNVTRYVVRLIGILMMTGLAISRLVHPAALPPSGTTASTQDKTNQASAEESSVANSAQGTPPPPPTPEAKAFPNSLVEQARRDLASVTSQFTAIIKASNEAESACNVDVATIESTDDIARRRDALMKFRAAQLEVIVYLQNFDNHCREALAPDNFPADFISGLLASERKSGKIDLLITLWQAKMKFTDDHIARFDYLAKSYGAWNVKDGKVVFADTDALAAYNTLTQALQDDASSIGDDQKQIAH